MGGHGSILEGVTNGITDNGCCMCIGAFTAVVAFFNVLLRIVPCTAGIGHEDSHHNTCYQSTCKQAAQCINAQQQTNYQRSCNCHDTGNQHFLQCCCCGNFYAFLVVGLACTFHDAGDGTELSSYFFNHFKCSFPLDCIVNAENRKGNIPPISRPMITRGFSMSIVDRPTASA